MKYQFNIVPIIITCLFLVSCTPTVVSKFELIEYGIVSVEDKGWRKTEDPNFGRTHSVAFEKVKKETEQIQAKIGTRFGMRFRIDGEPNKKTITVEYAGIHPQLTNPKTGKTFSSYKYQKKVKIGETRYMGYKFDHDWELVPGNWTLQVLYQGEVMVEKEFVVY